MSLQGKKIGVNLPVFQLKELPVIQQIDNLLTRGAEVIIIPRKTSVLAKVKENLDILIVFSPPEEMLKSLISRQLPAFKEIPLVLCLKPELNRQRYPLKYLSHLLHQNGIFFVPFGPVRQSQKGKESIILHSRIELLGETCIAALNNEQLEPAIWEFTS